MEFKKYLANEFCDSVRDGTHDSPKPKAEGYKLITSKHIGNNKLDLDSAYYISKEDYEKVNERSAVEINDVLFSMIGTIGNVFRITKKPDYAIKNIGLFKIKDEIKSKWMYYYLNSSFSKKYIEKMKSGSTQNYVTLDSLRNMPIIFPCNKSDAQKMLKILSLLDEKIETNNKINYNLQKLSQELYKHWFVDFEFLDENGKPYKSSGGKMIDSELGKIPEDWKVSTLGEVTTRINERSKNNNTIVLSALNKGELVKSDDYFKKQVYSKNTNNYIVVRKNEFAYNPARINIGSIGINNFEFDGCVSPVYVVFKAQKHYEIYIREFIKTSYFNKQVSLRASGSVRQTLNYDDFALIKLVYPPLKIINDFNSIYKDLYVSINKIEKNTETLVELREALLPKLISGEINLDKIDL